MTPQLLHVPPYASPEWLAWRCGGLGASDLPVILGVSPYMGEYELALLKRGELEIPDSPQMAWGRRIEAVALDMYEEAQGVHVIRGETWGDPAYPMLWATLDARVDGTAKGIEVKATGRATGRWQYPPDHVQIQAQGQMRLAALDSVDIVRVTPYGEPEVITLTPDPDLDGLLDLAAAWWARHGPGGVLPAVDGSTAAGRYLGRQRGSDAATATATQVALMAQLRQARADVKAAQETEALITNRLKASMGGTGRLIGDGFTVSWTPTKPAKHVAWALVAEGLRSRVTPEEWDVLVDLYTQMGEASTRFAPTWKG